MAINPGYLPRGEELWEQLNRTKAKRTSDIEVIAEYLQIHDKAILRAISDFVSMQAIGIAKDDPGNPEMAARQGLLVRVLAEVATKILTLELSREVETPKNDDTPNTGTGT
jgi:hypothetical protein